MLDKKEKKIKDNFCKFVFATFFVLILAYLFSTFQLIGDDIAFNKVLDNNSLFEYLKGNYLSWSSRVITDAMLAILTRLPFFIWQILHSIIMLFTALSIYEIAIPKDKKEFSFIIPFLFGFIPIPFFWDCGWMATTLNYTWPLAACMPFFVILKKTLSGEKISKVYIIFSYFSLFFACNTEQCCALIFSFSLLMICYNILKNRKHSFSFSCINKYFIFSLLISIFWLLITAFCPGTDIRFASEVKTWYPEFANLTLFEKIIEGFLITMTHFFTLSNPFEPGPDVNCIIFPLLIIMALNFLFKKKYILLTCIVLIACFSMFFGVQNFNLFKNNTIGTLSIFSNSEILIETFVFVIILTLIFVAIFASFDDKKKSFIALIIMFAGFCTRMIMSFSPTMHASSIRPSYAMAIAIIIITALVFIEFISTSKVSFRKTLLGSCIVLLLYSLANLCRNVILVS